MEHHRSRRLAGVAAVSEDSYKDQRQRSSAVRFIIINSLALNIVRASCCSAAGSISGRSSRDRRQTTVVSRGRLQDTRFRQPSSKAVHGATSDSRLQSICSSPVAADVRQPSSVSSEKPEKQAGEAGEARRSRRSKPEKPEKLEKPEKHPAEARRSRRSPEKHAQARFYIQLRCAHGETTAGWQRQSTVAGRTLQ